MLEKKTVAAKAKVVLQPISYTREMDQHCLQGNRSAYMTMIKSQGSPMKDLPRKNYKLKYFGPGIGLGLGP